jgi:hypothetical protein
MINIPEASLIACNNRGIEKDIYTKYAESLKLHINYVMEAWLDTLGGDYGEIEYHDHSKWFPAEFPFYAKHFFGGGDPDNFPSAWLHHLHNNDHHWQFWMFPDDYSPDGVVNGCIEMPTNCALEMIADWLGASKAYTGDWNMSGWLEKNFQKVRLHPNTKYLVVNTLLELGYKVEQ